jgi:uncharacterized protein YfkK (UPF0435 family)
VEEAEIGWTCKTDRENENLLQYFTRKVKEKDNIINVGVWDVSIEMDLIDIC